MIPTTVQDDLLVLVVWLSQGLINYTQPTGIQRYEVNKQVRLFLKMTTLKNSVLPQTGKKHSFVLEKMSQMRERAVHTLSVLLIAIKQVILSRNVV